MMVSCWGLGDGRRFVVRLSHAVLTGAGSAGSALWLAGGSDA
jgi:hypothetical protein